MCDPVSTNNSRLQMLYSIQLKHQLAVLFIDTRRRVPKQHDNRIMSESMNENKKTLLIEHRHSYPEC